MVLFACWYKAAFVGGMFSRDLRLKINMCLCAAFTVTEEQFLVYISTVSFSMRCIWRESSVSSCGFSVKLIIFAVTSGKFIQAFHSDFSPMPNILDVTSQPVNA